MEIELKLLIDPEQAEAFTRHPALARYAIGEPRRLPMTGTYFDTPELHLRRAEAGLRVRRVDGRWVQTMKAGGQAAGGLHQRNEWESEVGGPQPNLGALIALLPSGSSWAALLDGSQVADRLVPIFTTEMDRTVWNLALPDGTRVECVLDQGVLRRDEKTEPVSEIELELVSGSAESLIALALELQADLPLRIGHRSKAERGYGLFAAPQRRIAKAGMLELRRGMSSGAAFVAILRHCMEHIQANEPEVAEARSPENLHQMRVGFRRLRSALKAFRKIAPAPVALLEDSRWIAGLLGQARDFDVLADTTLPMVAARAPEAQDWQTMRHAAHSHAVSRYETAAEALRSSRYTGFVLRLHAWIMALERQADTGSPGGVRKHADKLLRRADRRVRQRSESLVQGDVAAAHRLRIAVKQFRYLLELFASLYSEGKTSKLLRALTGMQESLGRLNDGTVASDLLQQMEAQDGRLAFAAAFVRGYLSALADSGWQALAERQAKAARFKRPFSS